VVNNRDSSLDLYRIHDIIYMETTHNFKIKNLITPESIEGETLKFSAPNYHSIMEKKDFIEGELAINDKNVEDETIKNCLELSCALLNQNYFQIELTRRHPGLCLNATLHSTETLKEPKEFEKFFTKSLKLLSQDNNCFNYAQNWFMRSIKLMDPIDKFIYSWITFECLYGCLWENKSQGNINGIKCLIGNNYPEPRIRKEIVETHKDKFIYLSNQSLIDKRSKKNWSQELENSLKSNSFDKIIENGVMAIAMIRNSIFHGNIVDRNLEAGNCFFPLNHLNSEIIKKIILKFCPT
jgi:hypothetical protein